MRIERNIWRKIAVGKIGPTERKHNGRKIRPSWNKIKSTGKKFRPNGRNIVPSIGFKYQSTTDVLAG